jgi:hypothetical protein
MTIKTSRCATCGNERKRKFRCEHCGVLFSRIVAAEEDIPLLDKSYCVEKRGNEIVITRNWAGFHTWFFILFFIFWDSVIFKYLNVAEFLSDPLSFFPIPAAHLIIGVVGPTYILVCLINKTTIALTGEYLSIKHRPVPWWGGRQFPIGDIGRVLVSTGKRANDDCTWKVPVLEVVTIAGTRHQLMEGNEEQEFAGYEYLCHQIMTAVRLRQKHIV